VLGIGRGSILAALLIILLSIFFNVIVDVSRRRFALMLSGFLLVLISAFLLLANFDVIYSFLDSKTKITQGLYDPYRAKIIVEYVGLIDSITIFTGASYDGTVISSMYSNNPHVSIIRGHAYMGLSVLLLIFSPFYFFLMNGRLLDRFIFFSFTMILIFRSLSEPILFPTLLDFIYFYLFWLYINSARSVGTFVKRNLSNNSI